ncbi:MULTISPECIES: hypothetical protein [Brevibacillus]|uniref:Uncharacterized protein n=1 Tax=Brevibacillus invocatus TaxID=173959 RepID=A0A3M8BY18_9BACL|nr:MULTISPECIES: hypothetical protein [Brevibacillus]MDH4618167.1 hypothetical protein [Brevibacillus sp. AY1]RNB68342.1 hypothetical protein EDM52_21095 [Brevibacillus invocatus]
MAYSDQYESKLIASDSEFSEDNSKTTTKVVFHSAKYSMEDLKKEAPVIVKGKVIDSKKTERVDMNNNEDNDGDVDEVEFTDRVFKVQKVYKGTDVIKHTSFPKIKTIDDLEKEL